MRDARITNIYEGTSHLQVVVAVRGVTTGICHNTSVKYTSKTPIAPEHEYLRDKLKCMTDKLAATTAKVAESGNTE
ncbi:MAG: hypothetical protein V8S95_11935 [Odoribacter sp.]